MSWDKGFNFRATSVFVTDGANQTYSIGDAYPQTRNGVTFGWLTAPSTEDGSASPDPRLAGINYKQNTGTQITFQVDLPGPGSYAIGLALGSYDFAEGYQYAQVRDGSTPVLTVNDTDGTALRHFDDATGTDYTDVTWPGSNTTATVSLAGSTLNLVIGSPTPQAGFSTIAHLFVSQISSASIVPLDRAHSALMQNLLAQ